MSISSSTSISFPECGMSEARDCLVKLVDDHGVEHSVRVRAESAYEAALKGLRKLERIGWERTGEQIGCVTVHVCEEPTGPAATSGSAGRSISGETSSVIAAE